MNRYAESLKLGGADRKIEDQNDDDDEDDVSAEEEEAPYDYNAEL